jgi:undecaprenyl-diphosphatase
MPLAAVPLHLLAAAVGYSRVHTGVHFPGDVVAGAVLGATIADFVSGLATRRGRADQTRRSPLPLATAPA